MPGRRRRRLSPADENVLDWMRGVPADEATALEAARLEALRAYIVGLSPIRRRRR